MCAGVLLMYWFLVLVLNGGGIFESFFSLTVVPAFDNRPRQQQQQQRMQQQQMQQERQQAQRARMERERARVAELARRRVRRERAMSQARVAELARWRVERERARVAELCELMGEDSKIRDFNFNGL